MTLNDKELLRYSRHIMLPDIDLHGQQKILAAKVLIIGAGGLGSPVALYLAASGVGEISIVDYDVVELNNLQRQIAHNEASIGQLKVQSCADSMKQLNSDIKINTIDHELQGDELLAQVAMADIVVDCTDNLSSRFEINQACVTHKTWLVSAAAIRWEGQISVYHCGYDDSPCYHCFYGGRGELDQSCSNNGVLSPVVGVMGSMQAIEVIKLILDQETNCGDNLVGRVLLFDALSMQWESMQLGKNPNCSVCGKQ